MSEERQMKKDDKVNYSEKPDHIFTVKAVYYPIPIHHSEAPKLRIAAETMIDGKSFEIDAPDHYFTRAEE